MALDSDTHGISIQVSRGIVVASIQVDLDDDVLARFRRDLLDRVHKTGSRGVILDVSGLETLDTEELAALRRIIVMTALMGAESVLVGLRPGVVSALIAAGADVDGLKAAVNLDAAFAMFDPEPESEPDCEPDPEAEPATVADVDLESDLLEDEPTLENDR